MSPSMQNTSMELHLELDEELIKSLWIRINGRRTGTGDIVVR